jgi:hypothetical protein
MCYLTVINWGSWTETIIECEVGIAEDAGLPDESGDSTSLAPGIGDTAILLDRFTACANAVWIVR